MSDMAFSTMTLHDALIADNTLLDFISLSTQAQTDKFKEIFSARWDIYEIGGETIPLAKRFFANKFNIKKDYYQELIDDYENKIDYLDGIISNEGVSYTESNDGSQSKNRMGTENTDFIDLPNKQTTSNYISKKNNTNESISEAQSYEDSKAGNKIITRSGDVNILEQKKEYQNYLRNVYLEFAEEFKDCFVLLYD